MRRISYNDTYMGDAVFIPVCENCHKFVKPDEKIKVNEIKGLSEEHNATCKKCGRTKMIFEGFF